MRRLRSDSGAVAVEFALVMVPLLLILLGIIDFGRAFTNQLAVTAAAREGVRTMAIQNDAAKATQATKDAAQQLSPKLTTSQISIFPATCSSGASVTVTVTYPLTSATGMFSSTFSGKNLVGTAVMRCNG